MAGAIHIVAARLRADAPPEGVERAVEAARALSSAPGVETVLVARRDEQLVVATWLESRSALDAFAESRAHMAFVMQGLAPVIRGMWSAAVEAQCALPAPDIAAVWAFALPTTEGVFEWQIRDLLAAIEAMPGAASTGPTVEERERYRAGGIVCLTPEAAAEFGAALPEARLRWTEVAGALDEALADVLQR
jgi:heme-degrading monooxygenase HmoA